MLATNPNGDTTILKIAQSGEVLGLSSVIAGTPHELTAETLGPSQLAFVAGKDTLRFLKQHGFAFWHAAQHLGRDAQSAQRVIRNIALVRSVSARLACLLLQLSSSDINSLSHEEISQLVCSSRGVGNPGSGRVEEAWNPGGRSRIDH